MKNFDKYVEMLGEFNGHTILDALIYAVQHGDKTSDGNDRVTYQAAFTFAGYTPCIDTIIARYEVQSSTDYTFTVQYSNDVMEAVKVGKKPLVNESLCMLFDSIDDIVDSIIDCSVVDDVRLWLDIVAKKIRTEFIAAHAFIDANEEAQEAEKKIAEEQEAMKKTNAEEDKNILKDSVLKFIDHMYNYENSKDDLAKVKSKLKDISSEAFGTIVDGLSNAAKELSSRLDELQNKMDSEQTDADDAKTPEPDATVNEDEAKEEEESGCNYCPGPCCTNCPDDCEDDEDDEDDDDDWDEDDDYPDWTDITTKILVHIRPELLMSMHHKLMHSKEASVVGDIASNFFYTCCEKAAIRLRENKLRIDTVRRGTPLGGSYELEVYDRTTNKTVWCKTFDFHNVTPEMIIPYLDISTRKGSGHKYTTADFSAIDVRAMIFTALNTAIIQNISKNDAEIPLVISYIEGKDPDEIYDIMEDRFDNFFNPKFSSTACDITKIRTNAIPEVEEYIKNYNEEDEEDDDE